MSNERLFTRRNYLTHRMLLAGTDIFTAIEAVSSTALAHPEWDMMEEKTWDEWEGDDETVLATCPCGREAGHIRLKATGCTPDE